jgi:arabinofuranan 3-O-arabinosyltransferase
VSQWLRRRYDVCIIALLAYIPLLLSAPGKLPADTKLYLYLNPGRLLSDAAWTWDTSQLGGWVPHQNVGYLWPTGPWFAFFEWLNVPDWIAHRLWLGSLLVVAGLGARWLAKLLDLPTTSYFIAGIAYQLSPYVLPYISRTSALLLPWALLPWIIGLTLKIIREPKFKYFAIFGLVIMSSGGLNATALLMIAPAPVIWLVDAWSSRKISLRRALSITGILAVISGVMSAWWAAGLTVQGKYGASVLSYSEALQSTSATSTATEALRGLGYWLFYDRNEITALTSASTPYQNNLLVIIVGVALVIAGLVGLLSSQKLKRPLSLMLFIGIVLSVGAYPSDSSSPLWSYFADNPKSAISLALRSSSRAVPLIALTLAIGVALTVEQSKKFLSLRSPRVSSLALPVAVLLICLNVPALFGGRYIDPAISRPENLPTAWTQAAALLDTRLDEGHTGSVLILPGIESAAYRWGYPVDPILPGITKKPLITRDWLPLGSAPFMDLLYALDDSFQNGTADPNSIAPIARLLGADTIMVVNSYQYERFGVNRPERAASLIDAAPDLEVIATFGEPSINFVEDYETNDLLDYPATALPEISLYAVSDSVAGARITQNPIVVSADGSGMVDLAAAGLIDGKSSILASAALDEISLQDAVLNAPEVIVTDSNRKRAHQWRGSQEVWGATEGTAALVDSFDAFDNRLPVFPLGADRLETLSIAENNSGTSMSATMYGALLSYLPEYRPANANDGNVETSWAVGWGVNPIGQTLTYTSNMGLPMVEQLELIPAQFSFDHRFVTAVSVSVDNSDWTSYTIDPDTENTTIKLNQPGNSVRVRIDAVSSGNNQLPVGWAEILRADFQHQEVITVPSDATAVVTAATPVSYSFTRLQADEYKPYRQDPEQSINRHFFVDHEDQFTLTGHATSTTDFAASDICRDDLITIDGTIIPVRLSNVEGDQDQTFSFVGCEPVNLKIGHRTLLTSYDTSIHVDRIVLRSVSAQQPEASVVAPLAQSRTTRTTSITSCSDGCWLELTDGWNIGWKASLSGESLADPIASAGGRLLWNLPATPDNTKFETNWTPQKRMWIGIGVTLFGLLCALVVLAFPLLRRRTLRADPETMTQPVLIYSAITVITSAAIVGALVISPLYGLFAGLVTAATLRSRSIHKAGMALVTLGMLFLIAQQIRTGAVPSFGWPSVFRRSHQPILLGLVLITIDSWSATRSKSDKPVISTASVSEL